MDTYLEYNTRVVKEGDRRCKKSTLNDLAYLTPLRIPLMNPVSDTKRPKVVEYYCSSSIWRPAPSELEKSDPGGVTVKKRKENFPHMLGN